VTTATLVLPGALHARTGGTIYNRRIVEGLRRLGWSVDVRQLDESFPWPSASARDDAARAFASIPPGTVTLVDSLALGAIPEIMEAHASRLRLVALVHLPLASDPALDPATAAAVAAAEQRALEAVSRVIVTGRAALPLLAGYEIPPSRIVLIEPGTERASLATGSNGPTVQILSVGTLNPGKGHEDLLWALGDVPRRDWYLTCAGSLTRHPPTVERVRGTIDRLGLGARVTLAGDLDERVLDACYCRSDLFVLATRRETYGMAVAEALARGLPVIGTTTGAIPELVGDTAGVLVPPGDRRALAEALARVIGDAELRARYAAGARRVGDVLPRWEEATEKMARALEAVSHG
jgi:glycosyltransferase involved in cell wall biosynthesis